MYTVRDVILSKKFKNKFETYEQARQFARKQARKFWTGPSFYGSSNPNHTDFGLEIIKIN